MTSQTSHSVESSVFGTWKPMKKTDDFPLDVYTFTDWSMAYFEGKR